MVIELKTMEIPSNATLFLGENKNLSPAMSKVIVEYDKRVRKTHGKTFYFCALLL